MAPKFNAYLTSLFLRYNEYQILELKEYKKVHGHLKVPRSEGSLGRWVNNQRHNYRAKAKGQYSRLTNGRIKELEEVRITCDFFWISSMNGVLLVGLEMAASIHYSSHQYDHAHIINGHTLEELMSDDVRPFIP